MCGPLNVQIERMERNTTPMELDALEQALGLPGLFAEVPASAREAFRRFAAAIEQEAALPPSHPASGPADRGAGDA